MVYRFCPEAPERLWGERMREYRKADARNPHMGLNNRICRNPEYCNRTCSHSAEIPRSRRRIHPPTCGRTLQTWLCQSWLSCGWDAVHCQRPHHTGRPWYVHPQGMQSAVSCVSRPSPPRSETPHKARDDIRSYPAGWWNCVFPFQCGLWCTAHGVPSPHTGGFWNP